MIRNDSFWANHEEVAFVQAYFENHYNYTNGTNSSDCEYVYAQLTCDNFTMTAGEECWIYAEYNRCNDTYFYCSQSGYDANGNWVYEDCSE